MVPTMENHKKIEHEMEAVITYAALLLLMPSILHDLHILE